MAGRGEDTGRPPDKGSREGVARSTARPPAPWSALTGMAASAGDARLVRAAALAFLGTVAILALYFGSPVLIPTAVAVLLAFVLNPVVSWLRRLMPCWRRSPSSPCSPWWC